MALTLDDGPTAETTPALLDLFHTFGATATFFLSGERAERRRDLVARIVADGHDVYGHGWEHIPLEWQSAARLVADIDRAERLLAAFRPTPTPYLVRLPYNSGFYRPWVHRAIRSWRPDAQIAHWSLSMEDVLISGECGGSTTLDDVVAGRVRSTVADGSLPGAVVLLHEQPVGVPELRPAVAPVLVERLLRALATAGLTTGRLVPIDRPNALRRSVLI